MEQELNSRGGETSAEKRVFSAESRRAGAYMALVLVTCEAVDAEQEFENAHVALADSEPKSSWCFYGDEPVDVSVSNREALLRDLARVRLCAVSISRELAEDSGAEFAFAVHRLCIRLGVGPDTS